MAGLTTDPVAVAIAVSPKASDRNGKYSQQQTRHAGRHVFRGRREQVRVETAKRAREQSVDETPQRRQSVQPHAAAATADDRGFRDTGSLAGLLGLLQLDLGGRGRRGDEPDPAVLKLEMVLN